MQNEERKIVLDYGQIKAFVNEGQYGFITCTISRCKDVFFHLDDIPRDRYPLLRKEIAAQDFDEAWMWFEYTPADGQKKARLRKFHGNSRTVTDNLRIDAGNRCRKLLEDFSVIPSDELLFVAENLLGVELVSQMLENSKIENSKKTQREAKQRELDEQRKLEYVLSAVTVRQRLEARPLSGRRQTIKDICIRRGISKLIHFTSETNLESIFQHGLVARSELEARGLLRDYNDLHRIDNQTGAVSLSITFPNYQMFYKCQSPNRKFVMLVLDASILWLYDCAFCIDNAASMGIKEVDIQSRRSPESFELMFSDWLGCTREELALASNEPTSSQAEVLMLETVHPVFIKEVHYRKQDSNVLKSMQQHDPLTREYCSNDFYFKSRHDWVLMNLYRQEERALMEMTYD